MTPATSLPEAPNCSKGAASPWLVQNDPLRDDHQQEPDVTFKPALVCPLASLPGVVLWKSDRKFGTNGGGLRMLVTFESQ